ncbi:von Willebrand factor A domain-containing protein 9 [Biomphalaria pfeifferi]|uniref:Integrator complex subunit 14 n=1 Tax=Biomphalaria pfeifferi TaxID=112525 RepID=A0AAD8F639_BIOPF|nr:von Willebrand factor A domain-containing protein 9 [Biomphalaria pfeifferi]
MPTIIALDVSLSMSRSVLLPDSTEEYQRRHIAIHGINTFLDYLSANYKLEFVSLIAFSYLYEQLSTFTRDYSIIRTALTKVEAFSKTCIESALKGIKDVTSEEWSNTSCQVILITDGSLGVGVGSLKHSLETMNARKSVEEKFPLPFPFPCKLHIVCIANPNDPDVRSALPYYQKLINVGNQGGEIFLLDGAISFKSVEETFNRLAEKYYNPYCGTLLCGNFNCAVQLFPKPEPFVKQLNDEKVTYGVSDKIEIIGFLEIKDVGSPPTVARHLILPRSTKEKLDTKDKDAKNGKSEEEDDSQDDGKTPSFTVLLHGSLRVESMVAIARVCNDWYGMIYSWADSKKKSNLMLALFDPGQDSVPWLGPFDNLTSWKEYSADDEEKKSPFPVRPADKRSYAQSCVVWIKPSGLQSDIQKVLRHARKLPDKLHQFYKELNRTRRAALSFGFHSLLEALATMLDRECTLLPGSAHPNAALQLTHAANFLRSEQAFDEKQNVVPLLTNFASSSN